MVRWRKANTALVKIGANKEGTLTDIANKPLKHNRHEHLKNGVMFARADPVTMIKEGTLVLIRPTNIMAFIYTWSNFTPQTGLLTHWV